MVLIIGKCIINALNTTSCLLSFEANFLDFLMHRERRCWLHREIFCLDYKHRWNTINNHCHVVWYYLCKVCIKGAPVLISLPPLTLSLVTHIRVTVPIIYAIMNKTNFHNYELTFKKFWGTYIHIHINNWSHSSLFKIEIVWHLT